MKEEKEQFTRSKKHVDEDIKKIEGDSEKEHPWQDRLDEEAAKEDLKNSEHELPEFNPNEIHNYLGTVEKMIDERHENRLLKVLTGLDQTIFMQKLREWWNNRNASTQKMLYNMKLLGAAEAIPLFKTFVRLGFLEMKGMSLEDVDAMEKKEVKDLTTAFKIVKFFMPELKAFEPLVLLANKMPEFTNESREFLRKARQKDEALNEKKEHHPPRIASFEDPENVIKEENKKIRAVGKRKAA